MRGQVDDAAAFAADMLDRMLDGERSIQLILGRGAYSTAEERGKRDSRLTYLE